LTAPIDLHAFGRDLEALNRRVAGLRTSASSFGEGEAGVLDAALLELETAEDELRACQDELEAASQQIVSRSGRRERENQLLRQIFRHLPFALFVLDRSGTIRQANPRAATMVGTPLEFLAGKPLPVFIDIAARAPFRSHLAAVLHSGHSSVFGCQFSGHGHPQTVQVVISLLTAPDSTHPAALAAAWTGGFTPEPRPPALPRASQVPTAVDASVRLAVMSEMTRLLLSRVDDERLLQAAARLLIGECAQWAIIDLVKDGKPEREAVAGKRGPLTVAEPDSQVIRDLIATGGPILLEPIEDDAAFGRTPSGAPILAAARAGSLVSVAIPYPGASPAQGVAGALTLVRRDGHRGFSLADVGLFTEIAAHISMALGNRGRLHPVEMPALAAQTADGSSSS
jgi:sigma-B regulation protein RsbU (phosphoserine phosphatase)